MGFERGFVFLRGNKVAPRFHELGVGSYVAFGKVAEFSGVLRIGEYLENVDRLGVRVVRRLCLDGFVDDEIVYDCRDLDGLPVLLITDPVRESTGLESFFETGAHFHVELALICDSSQGMQDVVLVLEPLFVVRGTEKGQGFLGKGRSEDVDERADKARVDVRLPFFLFFSDFAVERGKVVGLVGVFPDVIVLCNDELLGSLVVPARLLHFGFKRRRKGCFVTGSVDEE